MSNMKNLFNILCRRRETISTFGVNLKSVNGPSRFGCFNPNFERTDEISQLRTWHTVASSSQMMKATNSFSISEK